MVEGGASAGLFIRKWKLLAFHLQWLIDPTQVFQNEKQEQCHHCNQEHKMEQQPIERPAWEQRNWKSSMVSSEVIKGKASHTELIAAMAEKEKKGAWSRGIGEDRKSYIGRKVGRVKCEWERTHVEKETETVKRLWESGEPELPPKPGMHSTCQQTG